MPARHEHLITFLVNRPHTGQPKNDIEAALRAHPWNTELDVNVAMFWAALRMVRNSVVKPKKIACDVESSHLNGPLDAPEYIADALSVLREVTMELAEDVAGPNIDSSLLSSMHHLASDTPGGMPTRDTVLALARVGRVFADFQPMVDDEWPEFCASRYRANRLMLVRIVRHYPQLVPEIRGKFGDIAKGVIEFPRAEQAG